jgi:hypothetical protein
LQRKLQPFATITTAAVMAACLLLGRPAVAQDAVLRTIASYFSIGGYYFTSGSASRAVGTPKFYTTTSFYTHPARMGNLELSGGVQLIGLNDHFFPFTGGNSVDWFGPVFRLATHRQMNRLRGVLTGGLYFAEVHSELQGFDVARFAPSFYVGLEYPFARYFTLSAGYRVSQDVHGVGLDGFSLALKLF